MVILAAGVGSRLGRPEPKCLSVLPEGRSIFSRQIDIAHACGIRTIVVVTGFKKGLLMEARPDALYCYNPYFHLTNTSKSLLAALSQLSGDVIWVNGDVIFHEKLLKRIVSGRGNLVVTDSKVCGKEEVKYRTNAEGVICEISKTVENPQGEALGINRICGRDLPIFIEALAACNDQDYFERGMELTLEKGIVWHPHDIGDLPVIEVDFDADWQQARRLFAK